jgi:hypothetical protein
MKIATQLLTLALAASAFVNQPILEVRENPIFTPKRTKLKGWQKEARRSTFNKHK